MSKSDQDLYLSVLTRIKSGEIKTDEQKGIQSPSGSIRLPQSASLPLDLQTASTDGEIYIFRPSSNQMLVIFKTWRGKGFNMEGFLYASIPLAPTGTNKDAYRKKIITLGPMDLNLEKQFDANWYFVSYKLD